jgi:hypothetical protein
MARYSAALLVLVVLGLLAACSSAPEPTRRGDLAAVAGRPDDPDARRSRWVGIGSYDACGLAWAFDLVQDGNRISGHMLWETVRYDLSGTLAPDGTLEKARAGKSPDFNGTPAPRFVIVTLVFGARRAVGHYAAETRGSHDCATEVRLTRYAAE